MSQQANDPASVLANPRNKYVPRSIRSAPPGAINAYDAAAKRLRIERYTRMVGEMERAGVGLLAGTDLASRSPGFSVHDELSLFVEGGLTPLQALQTATINPARYFGSNQFGTVERGKLADLVLLDANPLDDIHNTQRIRAVVANGRYFSRIELDEILSEVEAFADTK
jgi:imidazolonepropionase-like amidohydrolase